MFLCSEEGITITCDCPATKMIVLLAPLLEYFKGLLQKQKKSTQLKWLNGGGKEGPPQGILCPNWYYRCFAICYEIKKQ